MLNVSCTLWSVIRIPIFLSFNFQTICWISSTAIGSTPAKGSSSMINFGSIARQRAISVRRRSPPDNWFPLFFRTFCNRNSAIRLSSFSFWYSLGLLSSRAQKQYCLPHSSAETQKLLVPSSRYRSVHVYIPDIL